MEGQPGHQEGNGGSGAPSLSPGSRRPARWKDSQGIRKARGGQVPPACPQAYGGQQGGRTARASGRHWGVRCPQLVPRLTEASKVEGQPGHQEGTGGSGAPAGPGLEVQNQTLKVPCRSQHLLGFRFLPQTRNHIFGSIRLTRPFTPWKAKTRP